MNEVIRDLKAEIDRLKNAVGRDPNKQIRAKGVKEMVESSVRNYFDNIRPTIIQSGISEDNTRHVDVEMQDIFRFAKKAVTANRYIDSLENISNAITEVELAWLKRGSVAGLSRKDQGIVSTLKGICPGAAVSYEQGLADLNTTRVSWRGTVAEFREALRETLDTLAPDDEVMNSPGFKLEGDAKGPTMKQKAKYILKARELPKNAMDAPLDSISVIEDIISKCVRSVYARSSIGTHTTISKSEATRVKDYVQVVLSELLEIPS